MMIASGIAPRTSAVCSRQTPKGLTAKRICPTHSGETISPPPLLRAAMPTPAPGIALAAGALVQ